MLLWQLISGYLKAGHKRCHLDYLNGYRWCIVGASSNAHGRCSNPWVLPQHQSIEQEPEFSSLECQFYHTPSFHPPQWKKAFTKPCPQHSTWGRCAQHHCHAFVRATLTVCCQEHFHFMFKILWLDSFLRTLNNYTEQVILGFVFRERCSLFQEMLGGGKTPHKHIASTKPPRRRKYLLRGQLQQASYGSNEKTSQ